MKKQNLLKSSLILMISAALAKILGALFKIPLTNILGGVGMGYFSCAYSLFMPIYALTVTGLTSAVARMVATSAALGLYANIRRIRRTAMLLFSAVGTLGALIVIALALPFSTMSTGNSDSALAVLMIAPSVLFGCIAAVSRGYYEGLSNMYPTALSQLVEGVVKVAAGLLMCGYVISHGDEVMSALPMISDIRAAAAAAGILGVTLSTVGASLFLAVIGIFERRADSGDNTLMTRREIARELTATALPVGISSVVTNLTALVDMWTLIGCIKLFGCRDRVPEELPIGDISGFVYGSFAGIALTVFNLVPSVTNMLGKGALPCITEAWAKKDRAALKKGTSEALLTACIIAIPSAVGLGVLAPEVLHLLFSGQPDEAELCIGALRWLMPGMVCLCASYPIFSMLQAIGKPSSPLKIMLVGTAVKTACNLLLIPLIGVKGAALSTSVSYAIVLVLSLRVYLRSAGISLNIGEFAAVAYSGALCGAAAYLALDICGRYGFGNAVSIASAMIFAGSVYFVSLWLMSISIKGRKKPYDRSDHTA